MNRRHTHQANVKSLNEKHANLQVSQFWSNKKKEDKKYFLSFPLLYCRHSHYTTESEFEHELSIDLCQLRGWTFENQRQWERDRAKETPFSNQHKFTGFSPFFENFSDKSPFNPFVTAEATPLVQVVGSQSLVNGRVPCCWVEHRSHRQKDPRVEQGTRDCGW